ncbi:MAG TPA: ABC transporter permease [Candidatus Fimivicinus intestinavium]|nr:ABC transporter permease [Candidatus Fimivicinus intestinavium]
MNTNQEKLTKAVDRERKQIKHKSRNLLLTSIASIAVLLILWELSVRLGWITSRFFCAPSEVLAALIDKLSSQAPDGATLPVHILSSMKISMIGFLMAVVVGTPLGLLMGWYKPVDKFVRPVFNLIRPIPAVGWIPLMIVLLGIGLAPKVFIVFLSAFVAVVLNSYAGIKLTNQAMINVSKTCGASNFTIFRRVGIPSAMPMVFTGWKVGLGLSWSTLVAAEMLASNDGLGYMILAGRQFMRVNLIMVGMLTIGIIGLILFALLNGIEKFVLRWRQ